MIFDLPTALEFGGREWEINTDYRDIITILEAFDDPELTDQEKLYVCLHNLYKDFDDIPGSLLKDAYDAATKFIDRGDKESKQPRKIMDWAQDAPLLFPAINRVAGFEVRSVDYMHWWTFIGLFMEIHDSVYSTVLSLRQKKSRGKKLEKHEKEFWQSNRAICELKRKESESEKAEKERLKKILGG